MDRYFPPNLQLIAPSPKPQGQEGAKKQISYIPCDSFLKNCEYVLIYYSSFWCYPCRALSKILGERYQLLKEQHGDKVELILVSGDSEESEFHKSLSSIIWAAVPFENDDLRRDELPTKMSVDNIPTIVVIRCSDGKIVNEDAVSNIASDAECKNYPWKPKTFQEVLAMASFVKSSNFTYVDHQFVQNSLTSSSMTENNHNNNNENNNNSNNNAVFGWWDKQPSIGTSSNGSFSPSGGAAAAAGQPPTTTTHISIRNNSMDSFATASSHPNSNSSSSTNTTTQISYSDLVQNTKYIGLVFSAKWCVPCEGFMDLLYSVYRKVKTREFNALEIVLVPGDRDKASYEEYLKRCPFYCLPLNDPRVSILNQMFSVSSIPMFVTLNAQTGEVVNASAREDVCCDPDGLDCPWYPKPAPLICPFEPTNSCVEIFMNHPTVLLNLFDVEHPNEANAIIAKFRDAAAEYKHNEPPSVDVRFMITKNQREMNHTDYRTCLKDHLLGRAEQPMECTCDICGEPIRDDVSEKESDTVNINHFCCKFCGYDVCFGCWDSRRAGQPKDEQFWQALSGDLGLDLEMVPSKKNKRSRSGAYLTKFCLKQGKCIVMDPAVFDDRQALQSFFAVDFEYEE